MTNKLDNITSIPDLQIPRTRIQRSESDVSSLIDTYLREQRASLPKGREFLDSFSILDFLYLLRKVIESRQNTEGIKDENRILFLEEDPQEEIDTEAITFSIMYRKPGQFSKGPIGKGSVVRELTPHLRRYEDNQNVPGEKILTYGKLHDTKITFWCNARTDKVAIRRALWLTQVMDSFSWFFFLYGFRVIEQGIEEKEKERIKDLDIVKYPVTYIIQNDDTFQVSSQEFRELLLNLEISK